MILKGGGLTAPPGANSRQPGLGVYESLQSPVKMVFLYIKSCFPAFPITVSEPLSPRPQNHPLMEKSGLCHYWLCVLGRLPPSLRSPLFICNLDVAGLEFSAIYMSWHTHKILSFKVLHLG